MTRATLLCATLLLTLHPSEEPTAAASRDLRRDFDRVPAPLPLWQTELRDREVRWEAKHVPYDDVLVRPPSWPDFLEVRVATQRAGPHKAGDGWPQYGLHLVGLMDAMGWTIPFSKLANPGLVPMPDRLERRLPEIKFDGNELADVIDFLRDVTGANLYVRWRVLEEASIAKDAPVNARLKRVKFLEGLRLILYDVGGGNVELGYVLDEQGVIVISTRQDLAAIYGDQAVAPATQPSTR